MSELWVMLSAAVAANVEVLGIAIAMCCTFMVLERTFPAIPDSGLRSRIHNIFVFFFVLVGLLFLSLVSPIWGADISGSGVFARAFSGWDRNGINYFVVATLLYAVIWDFFQYWVHRAQHYFPILWKFHRIHHNDEAMNASTSLKQSFGSVLAGYFFVHIPTVALCGVDMLPVAGSLILFSGWGYLNHANIKWELGRLTCVVSGPQWHRLHHGKDSIYHDCNYSAFFPVFDIVFGTMMLPRKNEWPETGIEGRALPRSTFIQVFFPWRDCQDVRCNASIDPLEQ